MSKRNALIEEIKQQGLPSEYWAAHRQLPLVTLEGFFDGNDDFGSIGCNLSEHPGPKEFFRVLLDIRRRDDVQDVLVEVFEVNEEDEIAWPFSERIYIVTSAAREHVADWISPLHPDEVAEGFRFGQPAIVPPLQPDMKVYGAWWD